MIQPLTGDPWPAIDTAARTLISTFAKGSSPDATAASPPAAASPAPSLD